MLCKVSENALPFASRVLATGFCVFNTLVASPLSGGACSRRQTATVPILRSPAAGQQPRRPIKVLSQTLPRSNFRVPVSCEQLRQNGRRAHDDRGRLWLPRKAVSPAAMLRPAARHGVLFAARTLPCTCKRRATTHAFGITCFRERGSHPALRKTSNFCVFF